MESPVLRGPLIQTNALQESLIQFSCVLVNYANQSDAKYEIVFLFNDDESSSVPHFVISGSDGQAFLHEKYLVGQMNKYVCYTNYSIIFVCVYTCFHYRS